MRIEVRPAKREGTPRAIFHRSLKDSDFEPGISGGVAVSIEAEGIYADGSSYRYLVEFTRDELRSMLTCRGN